MSRPSFNFYPDNWMNDAGVRRCSPATRGVWIDLLCLMHQGVPYGHLSGPGGDHPVKFVAQWCGESPATTQRALRELEENGVFSRTDDGTIFSRRMVRDERNRFIRGAGGVKALENPNVPRPKKRAESIPSGGDEGTLDSRSNEDILPPGIGKGKGKGTLLENRSTETKPSTRACAPTIDQPDLFPAFWNLFVIAGKPLNDIDKERSMRAWMNYERGEHQAIVSWVSTQMKTTWSDEKYTPMPQNALATEGWKRKSEPRIVPDLNRNKASANDYGATKNERVMARILARAKEVS